MSRKFQFRHQPLLDVSKQRERSAQIELGRAQALEAEARRRLAAVEDLAAEWDGRIRKNQKGLLEPRLLREWLHAMEGVRQRAAQERESLRDAAKVVETARERVQEAARERKSYERLRERTHAEYEVETSRQLVKLSDDAASVRVAAARIGAVSDGAITGVTG